MNDYANKTVVVTGGSLGIGAEFAEQLAARGATLVLVARSQQRLDDVAQRVRSKHGVRVETIAIDLGAPQAATKVFERVQQLGLEADVLINNAGFGKHGQFEEIPLNTHSDMVTLNCTALVELTHVFLPMLERRRGGVLNVASTAAFQPTPWLAVYGASKAFVLSFSEALWAEYRSRGVRVHCLCPGATDTPFFATAGENAALGAKASVADVVRLGLKRFETNDSFVVHGGMNAFLAWLVRFMPRGLMARLSANLMKAKPQLSAGAPA